MSTITLYSSQINQMSSLLQKVSKSVKDLKDDILDLKNKVFQIDSSVCDIEDVITSLRNATSIDEEIIEKVNDVADLMDDFVDMIVEIDEEVAELITQGADDFYDAYPYLAPQPETILDSLLDALTGFAEWAVDAFASVLEFIGQLLLTVLAVVAIIVVAAIAIVLIIGLIAVIVPAIVSLFTFLASVVVLYVFPALLAIGAFMISHPILTGILLISTYFFISSLLNFIGNKTGNTDLKEISFAMRHPIIAFQVGQVVQGKGKTNISTNCTRFANDFDFMENDEHEGSEVNAFRHALWVAILTNKWGEGIANEISNSHESNSHSLDNISDPYSYQFTSLSEADEVVDLLNNRIGVQVGQSLPEGSSQKDVVRAILDYYHEYGLNIVVRDENGYYTIEQQPLSDERYYENLNTLEQLDSNGFPPDSEYYNGDD